MNRRAFLSLLGFVSFGLLTGQKGGKGNGKPKPTPMPITSMTAADVIAALVPYCTATYRPVGYRSIDYTAPTYNSPIRTFYVDGTSGNDSNAGTSGSPFLTLSKISSTATPGDLFYLKGTFTGQWLFPTTSGTSTDRITIANWPTFTPVISGGLSDGGVILDNVSYWVVDGLEITGMDVPARCTTSTSHHNWIKNCYVHNSGGTYIAHSAHHNRFESNRIGEIGGAILSDSNGGDGIFLLNDAHDNYIIRNTVERCGHAGIDLTLQSGNSITYNNVIAMNIVNNPFAGGIIISGFEEDCLVEGNFILNCGREHVYSGSIGTRSGLNIHGPREVVHHNIVYNCDLMSILVAAYVFAGNDQTVEDCQIYNNTCVGGGDNALMLGISAATVYNRNNTIKDNLFHDHVGRDGANGNNYDMFLEEFFLDDTMTNSWSPTDPTGNVVKNNTFSTLTGTHLAVLVRSFGNGGNVYWNTQSALVAAYTTWTNNIRSDPQLVDPASYDFHLQAGSPALTGSSTGGVVGALGSTRVNRVHHILKIR
jgi:parallel beta-helix repeat protein